ncbi:MAG: allantoin racemase [Alphaproteobacteria bacterium]|nr:allantoin racemase [Alphaproteobacteria bacterium]
MRRPHILVINPNSNTAVTAAIDAAVNPFRFADGPEIACTTLEEGPRGVETQKDADSVTMPLRRIVEGVTGVDAFVIACYSDPGLHVCREGTSSPVFGIGECAIATALTRGERFGVIAIGARSIARHLRSLRQTGTIGRLAGERSLDMSVAETASGDRTLERMIEVGRMLVQQNGADVVVMGCAGMARHRAALQQALGIPVIDPIQAAISMVIGAVQTTR